MFLTRTGPRFHHGGYVVESFNDIVHACDIAGNLGFKDRIEHGPGRHGHQHSYYCYLRDPDGHRTELLLRASRSSTSTTSRCPARCSPGSTPTCGALPAPKSWVEEATSFAGVTVVQGPDGVPLTAERFLSEKKPDAVMG